MTKNKELIGVNHKSDGTVEFLYQERPYRPPTYLECDAFIRGVGLVGASDTVDKIGNK